MRKAGVLLTAVIFIMLTNINTIKAQEMKRADFKHTVFFWLNNPDSKADREAFEKSIKKFIDSSEFLQTKYVGTPADTDREVIDNSYTYCLMVSFANKEDHDKYQAEDAHKLFIEESASLWEKVLVYDSESIW